VGKWTAAGSTGDPMHGWVANYEFKSNGTFTMNGYPPIEVSGRWEVLEKAPGKLRVKLSKQKMKSPGADVADWADTEGWGDLSSDGRSFNFDGKQMNRQDPAPEAK
jgi:hypothetical protein